MSVATMNPAQDAQMHVALPRTVYEDFLYQEAALLDEWRLDEWYSLFTADAIYEVPTAGSPDDISSAEALFYIADDHGRLGHRVKRLNKSSAHAEFPRSKTARIVSNVRILGEHSDGVAVGCTFVTYRSRNDAMHIFCGHMRYILRQEAGVLKIVSKRVFLDMSSLRSQGRVSIIL